ncbi:hypothetical protein CsSME_00039085 [Camellia sinensis var. sinensis]
MEAHPIFDKIIKKEIPSKVFMHFLCGGFLGMKCCPWFLEMSRPCVETHDIIYIYERIRVGVARSWAKKTLGRSEMGSPLSDRDVVNREGRAMCSTASRGLRYGSSVRNVYLSIRVWPSHLAGSDEGVLRISFILRHETPKRTLLRRGVIKIGIIVGNVILRRTLLKRVRVLLGLCQADSIKTHDRIYGQASEGFLAHTPMTFGGVQT